MHESTRPVELERGALPCGCGCGRSWLVSRGELRGADIAVPFVAIPTRHDQLTWWIGLELDGRWTLTRSWLAGGDASTAVVDAAQSPVTEVLAAAAIRTREEALAEPAHKAEVFALLDRMVTIHPDARHLTDGEDGRDFSFGMPDCVFAQPREERSSRNGQNFAELGDRRFVRALLPIPMFDGSEQRIGLWVEVSDEQFMALVAVFWDDETAYAAMRVTGQVESSFVLGGHDVRGVEVTLAARDPSQCLFVLDTDAPWLAARMREPVPVAGLSALLGDIRRAIRPLPLA